MNKDSLTLIGKVIERFGIYIAVGVFVFFAWSGWQSMSKQADLLEQRNIMLEQKMEAWNQYIGELVKQQQKVVEKVEEKKIEQKLIKLDVGKEIKSFNKTVKEIKKIEDPAESIKAMRRAWKHE